MAYTVHNFEQGDVLYAEQLNEMDAQIAANEESIENSVSSDMLASDYSANKTYSIGDYVIYNNELYTCIYEITAPEGWNSAHWRIANLGDGIGDLTRQLSYVESALGDLDNGLIAFHPNVSGWYRGYFTSSGSFVPTTTNAAPTNTPFLVAANSTLKILVGGFTVQVRRFTKSGDVYTQTSVDTYTTDQTIKIANEIYMTIHIQKSNGASFTLDAVTTKIYFTSNIENSISALETFVGNTSMGTTATTITGAVAEHEAEIESIKNDLESVGYVIGDSVTLQTVNNAASFVLNNPSGDILVESTDAPIFTGSVNNVDLLNIKQGTFTDTTSGVTIEVSGNEIYIHGTTTAGFRYDLQKGEFYTDSLINHPANLDILPACTGGYRFCFWEKTGYTMPSNIYCAALKPDGTIDPNSLATHSQQFNKNGTYLAFYSNVAITGIDIKFTVGLKVLNTPTTVNSIESTAKTAPSTTVIQGAGRYTCGALTWTGDSTNYTAYHLTRYNPSLTFGHTFAWFGDSISQLKELPNLVSDLINATVYDCTFAGSPLTYGDPTLYQPTGFMSLCSQIADGDFSALSAALTAQQNAGIDVTEKLAHLATLQSLDFSEVTDIVVFAGTNDFDNDYVNATNFVSGFSGALETLLTEYPHLMVYVFSPIWRGDKTEGQETIPTMPDLVDLEKEVADAYSLPFYDLYHRSGINEYTATVYLQNDLLHPTNAGDSLLANKCAKFIRSN